MEKITAKILETILTHKLTKKIDTHGQPPSVLR